MQTIHPAAESQEMSNVRPNFESGEPVFLHRSPHQERLYFGQQIAALKDLTGKRQIPEDVLPSPYTSSLSQEIKERMKSSLRKK